LTQNIITPCTQMTTWFDVTTFDDLLHLNEQFIEGKLTETPYYLGPLEDDSKPLIPDLLKLHKYKLFTTNGQSETCIYNEYDPENKKYVNIEQRAYVSIIYEQTSFNLKFIQALIAQIAITWIIFNSEDKHESNN
jgi:hypothetical protein